MKASETLGNERGRTKEETGRNSLASKMGPENRGSGPRQEAPGWDRSPEREQKPGAGTHGASRRKGLLCSAYPWGGGGAGAARPPPPCRLADSTSGLEKKREGRWGWG